MTLAALRYNNPGDVSLPIAGWTGGGTVVGIHGQVGYASFPDMATGYAAMQQRLTNYVDTQGLNTIAALNTKYAEDKQNWANAVSQISGIGINDPIDTGNPAQMQTLANAIIRQETGLNPIALGLNSSNWASGSPNYVDSAPIPSSSLPAAAADGGAFGTSGPNAAAAGGDPGSGASASPWTTSAADAASTAPEPRPSFPIAATVPKKTGNKVARVGDVATHGAHVITGHPTISTNDRNHARIGDLVSCPIHGVNPIISSNNGKVINGDQKGAHVSSVSQCGAQIITGSEDIDHDSLSIVDTSPPSTNNTSTTQ